MNNLLDGEPRHVRWMGWVEGVHHAQRLFVYARANQLRLALGGDCLERLVWLQWHTKTRGLIDG